MATSTLINHRGAVEVSEEELALVPVPASTASWFPVGHHEVLASVKETLTGAGFSVARQTLSLTREGHRFFGTLDLTTPIRDGISLAVGVRNSTDKSFPIGLACGNRVFVCDNLSFTAEIVVNKKHTRFGRERYLEGIANAVSGLNQYKETAAAWINRLAHYDLSEDAANSYLLQMYEKDIIGTRLLPLVIQEWRQPSYDDYRPRNAWSLFNACTTVLGRMKQSTRPAEAALTTMRLSRLLTPEVIDVEFNEVPQAAGTVS